MKFEYGKIDNFGALKIQRPGGRRIKQYCPFDQENARCSERCPLFGDPIEMDAYVDGQKVKEYSLPLCKKILTFKKFKDEREKREGS